MTDKETVLEMIKRAPAVDKNDYRIDEDVLEDGKPESSIRVYRGYCGFVAVFTFDPAGSLLDIAAWE